MVLIFTAGKFCDWHPIIVLDIFAFSGTFLVLNINFYFTFKQRKDKNVSEVEKLILKVGEKRNNLLHAKYHWSC